jgi:hypothetical protein
MATSSFITKTDLQLQPWDGSAPPTPAQLPTVTVNAQRAATLSNLPTGAAATDYEYQFRPAPTVNAQRVADLTQTLAPGESFSDYEYQVR